MEEGVAYSKMYFSIFFVFFFCEKLDWLGSIFYVDCALSIGWPCFPFSIGLLETSFRGTSECSCREYIIPRNTRAWLCSYSLISLSRGVFALYKLGRPKIRRIKRLKLAWSRHWPVCPWPLKLSSGTLWVKSKAPVTLVSCCLSL